MQARFTPTALARYLDELTRIARENARAASALNKRVGVALRRLERFPNSGRRLPEFPHLSMGYTPGRLDAVRERFPWGRLPVGAYGGPSP